MSSINYQTSIQRDSFLDAEPLHLSGTSALDDFDFIVDEEGEESGPLFANSCTSADRPFSSSSTSAEMDVLLYDSRGSIDMDFQFDTLTDSLNKISVDGTNDILNDSAELATTTTTKRQPGGYRSARQSQCLHESWPGPGKQRRFQINAVNFDPPSELLRQKRRSVNQSAPPRQMSHGDLSSSSFLNKPLSSLDEDQYTEALQKLAESMKRTEESRKHVMMQRTLLTPAQQHALFSAKEQLNRAQPQAPTCQVLPSQKLTDKTRASALAAFFSGSRGTLTNGVEQSRKQLGLYMGSMNNQTL